MRRTIRSLLVLILVGIAPCVAQSQVPATSDPSRIQLTRTELQALLERYDEATQSQAYSALFQDRVRSAADLIQDRLADGDFQVGDQVVLSVAGEAPMSATFTVRPGRVIHLPEIGEVELHGVLRSELEEHLRAHLSRYLREPQVQATALLRIVVSGAVGQPGFFMVPAQALLSETIMTAGGFAANADVTRIRVLRDRKAIWEGRALQQAIAEGQTLDQMSLRAGDHVVVEAGAPGSRFSTMRTLILSLPPLVLAIAALQGLF